MKHKGNGKAWRMLRGKRRGEGEIAKETKKNAKEEGERRGICKGKEKSVKVQRSRQASEH